MADDLPQMHCPTCRSNRVVRQGSLCDNAYARCLQCWGRSTIKEAIETPPFPYSDQPAGRQRLSGPDYCKPTAPKIPENKLWTMRELAEALNVPRDRVRKWHLSVGLPFHEPAAASRNVRWVSHQEFIEFIRRKPWLFRRVDLNRLSLVVANAELMELVKRSKGMKKGIGNAAN